MRGRESLGIGPSTRYQINGSGSGHAMYLKAQLTNENETGFHLIRFKKKNSKKRVSDRGTTAVVDRTS